MKKRWYEFLWIAEIVYLCLGLINILFAWLGLIFFVTPLVIAIVKSNKSYCEKYCGRGQLLRLIGWRLRISLNRKPPIFLRSVWVRYGFMAFFMTMFGLMIYNTVLVFTGAKLIETITLLWVFRLPWQWGDLSFVPTGVAQFAFGFYGVMLTSAVLGYVSMLLFRARTWCVYCPMGTMTQGICLLKNRKEEETDGGTSKTDRRVAENTGEREPSADLLYSDGVPDDSR